jgi:hypothetical protein
MMESRWFPSISQSHLGSYRLSRSQREFASWSGQKTLIGIPT